MRGKAATTSDAVHCREPLAWSLESLQPHRRDLLQVAALLCTAPLVFRTQFLARSTSATADPHTRSRQKSACAPVYCCQHFNGALTQRVFQELYRCSNGGWVALSAFAVYTSFRMPVCVLMSVLVYVFVCVCFCGLLPFMFVFLSSYPPAAQRSQ